MKTAWITLDVKVRTEEEGNEVPSATDVASEIRQRMEDLDMDTGWQIIKVSASTVGGF